jgi:hypothetical protein
MRKVMFILPLIAAAIGDAWLLATQKQHRAVVLLTCTGLALAVLMLPGFWTMLFTPTRIPQEANAAHVPMSRRRMFAAYGVILFIIGGSFLDLARDTEHWPWSCYPMYSYPESGTTFSDLRLYGVIAGDPKSELPLYNDERFVQPFDQSRMAEVLAKTSWMPGIDDGLRNCLKRYETLRRAGRHDGPALSGLRLYKVYWTLDPWGANIDKPDKKVLLHEVSLPPIGKS